MGPGLSDSTVVLAVIFVILVFLNGIFALVESSLRRLRPGLLEEQAEDGSQTAESLLAEQPRWDRYIRTAQFCRIMCVLFLAIWVAWPLTLRISEWLGNLYGAFGLVFLTISFGWLTFSVLIPDGIAAVRSERSAVILLWFSRFLGQLFLPITGFANQIAGAILRMMGITSQMQEEEAHNEEELRQIVSASQRGGQIDEVEEELIDNVLDFTDRLVREIMIPRQDMTPERGAV